MGSFLPVLSAAGRLGWPVSESHQQVTTNLGHLKPVLKQHIGTYRDWVNQQVQNDPARVPRLSLQLKGNIKQEHVQRKSMFIPPVPHVLSLSLCFFTSPPLLGASADLWNIHIVVVTVFLVWILKLEFTQKWNVLSWFSHHCYASSLYVCGYLFCGSSSSHNLSQYSMNLQWTMASIWSCLSHCVPFIW